jgi:rhamnogalacturonyl hydrolase YesR
VWVKRLWDLQPDVEHKLYAVYSPAEGLVKDYAPDQEVAYVTRKDDPWQYHYNGGIAAAFLTKLYMATGEQEWLNLARAYQEFSMTTDECQFQSMQVCKSGWGSGMLYVATRQGRYRDWTVRLGDWFVGNQFEDGHWENTKHWVPRPTATDNIEITAEFVMHLTNIVAYLCV